MPGVSRNKPYSVRLSPEDREAIARAAKQRGETAGDFIRRAAIAAARLAPLEGAERVDVRAAVSADAADLAAYRGLKLAELLGGEIIGEPRPQGDGKRTYQFFEFPSWN